jgi:hypothetical protein
MAAQYDIAVTAGIDGSGVEQGAKQMQRETRAFASAAENEFKRVQRAAERTSRSYDDLNKAAIRANKEAQAAASKNPMLRNVGGVALQAQDIAVQLSGGAKAATVIAQQGSQIASLFGPTGMIVGGVLAIGAGIYQWATNTEKATKKLDEFTARIEKAQRLSDAISTITFKANDEAENINARRSGGALAEQQLIRQKDMARELAEVWKNYSSGIYGASSTVSMAAKDQAEDAIRKKFAAMDTLEVDQRILRIVDLTREAEQASVGAAEARIRSDLEIEKADERSLELCEQEAEAQKRKGEEIDRQEKKAKTLMEHARELAALASKGLHGLFDQYGLEAQSRELASQLLMAKEIRGKRIVDKAEALIDPRQAHIENQRDNRLRHAIKTISEREVDKEDQDLRRYGGRGLTPAQRRARVADRIKDADNFRKGQIQSRIAKEDIDTLARRIAEENAKNLAK